MLNVKKIFFGVSIVLAMAGSVFAAPITFTSTAGDTDFGATRSAYDTSTNMDYYVFKVGSGQTGAATNSLGIVDWGYVLPNQITTALSGSMTVRVWDIDPGDIMEVYFDFGGGNRTYAGLLTGSNGGNVFTWEGAVANGTTASLSGWSTTTFNLDAAALAALSGSSAFNLDLDVKNEASGWAAVIDYADFTLSYEPGAENPNYNPVPEPSTMLLLGGGLAGLAFWRRRQRNC